MNPHPRSGMTKKLLSFQIVWALLWPISAIIQIQETQPLTVDLLPGPADFSARQAVACYPISALFPDNIKKLNFYEAGSSKSRSKSINKDVKRIILHPNNTLDSSYYLVIGNDNSLTFLKTRNATRLFQKSKTTVDDAVFGSQLGVAYFIIGNSIFKYNDATKSTVNISLGDKAPEELFYQTDFLYVYCTSGSSAWLMKLDPNLGIVATVPCVYKKMSRNYLVISFFSIFASTTHRMRVSEDGRTLIRFYSNKVERWWTQNMTMVWSNSFTNFTVVTATICQNYLVVSTSAKIRWINLDTLAVQGEIANHGATSSCDLKCLPSVNSVGMGCLSDTKIYFYSFAAGPPLQAITNETGTVDGNTTTNTNETTTNNGTNNTSISNTTNSTNSTQNNSTDNLNTTTDNTTTDTNATTDKGNTTTDNNTNSNGTSGNVTTGNITTGNTTNPNNTNSTSNSTSNSTTNNNTDANSTDNSSTPANQTKAPFTSTIPGLTQQMMIMLQSILGVRANNIESDYQIVVDTEKGDLLAIVTSSGVGRVLIRPLFNFIQDFWLYYFHDRVYPKYLNELAIGFDLMAKLRLKPSFLQIDFKIPKIDQKNAKMRQYVPGDRAPTNVYFLKAVENVYACNFVMCIATFCAILLMSYLLSKIQNPNILLKAIHDYFRIRAALFSLLFTLLAPNLTVLSFYASLQLTHVFCFSFLDKLNVLAAALSLFLVVAFSISFYVMVYSFSDKTESKSMLELSKFSLKGFVMESTINCLRCLVRGVLHSQMLVYSRMALAGLLLLDLLLLVQAVAWRRKFDGWFLFLSVTLYAAFFLVMDVFVLFYRENLTDLNFEFCFLVCVCALVLITLFRILILTILSIVQNIKWIIEQRNKGKVANKHQSSTHHKTVAKNKLSDHACISNGSLTNSIVQINFLNQLASSEQQLQQQAFMNHVSLSYRIDAKPIISDLSNTLKNSVAKAPKNTKRKDNRIRPKQEKEKTSRIKHKDVRQKSHKKPPKSQKIPKQLAKPQKNQFGERATHQAVKFEPISCVFNDLTSELQSRKQNSRKPRK